MRTRTPCTAAAAVIAAALLAPAVPGRAAVVPEVLGHRGYTGTGCTEDTTCAFKAALARGANGVEMDVRFTRTGYPVIMHDATVDRTTTGSGKVSGMTVTHFVGLHTNDGGHPPTLAQALYATRKAGGWALVELKTAPTKTEMSRFDAKVEKAGMSRSNVIVQSFSSTAVWTAKRDGWKVWRLLNYGTTASWTWNYNGLAVPYDHISQAGVTKLHSHGVQVCAWTVDSPSDWARLAAKGVDAIVSDMDPSSVKRAVS